MTYKNADGSRSQYAAIEQLGDMPGGLGPRGEDFLGERDTFYNGEPWRETGLAYLHTSAGQGF